MQQRSPIAVLALSFITFGIYGLVWEVKTKNELNALGAEIPTAWLLIVPFVNIYWIWKYSEGVEKATNGQTSAVLAFVMLFLLSIIGMAILQNEFNKLSPQAAATAGPMPPNPGPAPVVPVGPTMPAAPAPMPGATLPSDSMQPGVTDPNGPSGPTPPAGMPPNLPPSPIQ